MCAHSMSSFENSRVRVVVICYNIMIINETACTRRECERRRDSSTLLMKAEGDHVEKKKKVILPFGMGRYLSLFFSGLFIRMYHPSNSFLLYPLSRISRFFQLVYIKFDKDVTRFFLSTFLPFSDFFVSPLFAGAHSSPGFCSCFKQASACHTHMKSFHNSVKPCELLYFFSVTF